ncbi:hypothetical protein [Thermogemmatispora sp.]|uniref:hypothetical protein n=1 Tax=Thermogemmatispora sp. TaxID=1968838 RepID=UPI001D4BC77A|nr:hypothetical protein [Thermogemmatispora sp.]MBX5449691.1 hypothetical protein [Thermogemmatispora sp.]
MEDFTLEGYRRLLLAFANQGYHCSLFDNLDERLGRGEKLLILRHDIDISLKAAWEMARLEHELGFQATYFVMLSSPFYNVLSTESAHLLDQIHAYGHDIALHIDLQDHHGQHLNVELEIEILAHFYPYVNRQIASVHSPRTLASIPVEQARPIYRVYHLAQRGDLAYISDSTGRWRYGHPLQSTAFHEGKAIQLLTHPIWWVAEGATPRQKLESWLYRHYERNLELARTFLPKLFSQPESEIS